MPDKQTPKTFNEWLDSPVKCMTKGVKVKDTLTTEEAGAAERAWDTAVESCGAEIKALERERSINVGDYLKLVEEVTCLRYELFGLKEEIEKRDDLLKMALSYTQNVSLCGIDEFKNEIESILNGDKDG